MDKLTETKVSISLLVKILLFIIPIAGIWFKNEYEVMSLREDIEKLEELHQEYNIGVMNNNIYYNRKHIDGLEEKIKTKKDK